MGTQLPQRGTAPPILGHVCCGQTARWIKMPLGREVDVGRRPRRYCVRWGPATPKGHSPPNLAPVCCAWQKGWMDQDATWYPQIWPLSVVHGKKAGWIKMPLGIEVGHDRDHIVLDGDPLPKEMQSPRPNFRPIYVVAKPLDKSKCHLLGRWTSAQATLC